MAPPGAPRRETATPSRPGSRIHLTGAANAASLFGGAHRRESWASPGAASGGHRHSPQKPLREPETTQIGTAKKRAWARGQADASCNLELNRKGANREWSLWLQPAPFWGGAGQE